MKKIKWKISLPFIDSSYKNTTDFGPYNLQMSMINWICSSSIEWKSKELAFFGKKRKRRGSIFNDTINAIFLVCRWNNCGVIFQIEWINGYVLKKMRKFQYNYVKRSHKTKCLKLLRDLLSLRWLSYRSEVTRRVCACWCEVRKLFYLCWYWFIIDRFRLSLCASEDQKHFKWEISMYPTFGLGFERLPLLFTELRDFLEKLRFPKNNDL